ncbi:MAG: sensor histidine kinase [Prochloraceae cyanobacterium]
MSNFAKIETIRETLERKKDKILENWRNRNREHSQIPSSNNLSDSEIENSILPLLKALATALSELKEDNYDRVAKKSLHHGEYRALQGFSPDEIVREYRLLREEIFKQIKAELKNLSATDNTEAFLIINSVLDEAVGQCFSAYMEQKLSEEKNIKKQLSLNNEELKRLCEVNRDRTNELVHELKTPLASIIGFLQLVPQTELDFIPQKGLIKTADLIEKALRSSWILLKMINDSLELSYFESDRYNLKLTQINPISLLDSCLEIIEPLAKEKNLIIETNYEKVSQEIITDVTCLRQILINLLSNAVRYTERGKIAIDCIILTEKKYSISIIDTGIGISPEQQKEIFEPFYRSSEAKEKAQGTGLGLTIAGKLIHLLQGEINLESQVGSGSKFTIILPQKLAIE